MKPLSETNESVRDNKEAHHLLTITIKSHYSLSQDGFPTSHVSASFLIIEPKHLNQKCVRDDTGMPLSQN